MILLTMSIVTELVFWNEAANRSRGWKVLIAHPIVSAALRLSSSLETSRGSIVSPVAVVSAEASAVGSAGRGTRSAAIAGRELRSRGSCQIAHSPSPRSTL